MSKKVRKLYKAFGREQTINEWADEYHMKMGTLVTRIYTMGWTLEAALTTKLKPNGRRTNAWNTSGEAPLKALRIAVAKAAEKHHAALTAADIALCELVAAQNAVAQYENKLATLRSAK